MKKLLHLSFIPHSADLALLALRVVFGFGMFWLHGRGKLMDFSKMKDTFPDPLGIGHQTSFIFALLGEVVCGLLLTVGAFTRLAAIGAAITMGVAFFSIHGGKLTGEQNGEMAFLYFVVYVALFVSGAGRYSVDAKLGAKV